MKPYFSIGIDLCRRMTVVHWRYPCSINICMILCFVINITQVVWNFLGWFDAVWRFWGWFQITVLLSFVLILMIWVQNHCCSSVVGFSIWICFLKLACSWWNVMDVRGFVGYRVCKKLLESCGLFLIFFISVQPARCFFPPKVVWTHAISLWPDCYTL